VDCGTGTIEVAGVKAFVAVYMYFTFIWHASQTKINQIKIIITIMPHCG